MKKLFLILTLFVSFVFIFNAPLTAQPVSEYEITWNTDTSVVNYKVFLWEGTTQMSSPFTDGQDYLSPDVSSFLLTETANSAYTVILANNGQFVQVAVVAENVHGLYSELGVSAFIVKAVRPNKPQNIIIKKK